MTKSEKGKTVGYCEVCEKFYPEGEYELKFDHIMCKKHMTEWEANHKAEVELAKRAVKNYRY